MTQFSHRILHRDDYVELYDGRGTTTMPWPEFQRYAEFIASVAQGEALAQSETFVEPPSPTYWEPPKALSRNEAARASLILEALGLGPKAVRRRKV